MKSLKWLPRALFGLFVMVSCRADAQTLPLISVTSNRLVEVLGPANVRSGFPAWVTNLAYVAGQKVTAPNGMGYLCITGGTSTNAAASAPSGRGLVTEGTVTWMAMLGRKRNSLVVQNASTNSLCDMYVTDFAGFNTNISKAVWLQSGGSLLLDANDSVPQGSIFIWSDVSASAIVFEN